jgi:iron-sulfur cluster assembly protein
MNKEVKVRARPAAITLTSAAQDRVAELMSRAPENAIGVKLSTPRRGCSGLAYSVDYVTEANPLDEKIETPGGTFYVDGGSVLYLIGSVMDWREDDSPPASCSRTRTRRARAAAVRASPSDQLHMNG